MKIEYQENVEKEGYKLPLMIEGQKTAVWLIRQYDINQDKYSLRGPAVLLKRLAKELDEKCGIKSIFVSLPEFYQGEDHLAKVNYLVSCGIVPNVQTNTYDFSDLRSKTEGVLEKEEVEEDGAADKEST
jgi:hypothetical protein